MGDKVGENPAALRAAVFLLSAKNRRGGVFKHPPPSRAKVNIKNVQKDIIRKPKQSSFWCEVFQYSIKFPIWTITF